MRTLTDWEATFRSWAGGPGDTEIERCENAERMIRKAIAQSAYLSALDIEVFAQGSYKNLTNIPQESDVDVAVCLRECYYYQLPSSTASPADYGITTPASENFATYKNEVQAALAKYFGKEGVTRGNKAIRVHSNSYRVDADVVACWVYRWHHDATNRAAVLYGTKFFADDGKAVQNWPKQHTAQDIAKNDRTQRRFKRVVRILKRLQVDLVANGKLAEALPSFFVESLVSNVPDEYFGHDNYTADVRDVLAYLFNNTRAAAESATWKEANRIKFLFHVTQPWTVAKAHALVDAAWDYVGFA